MERVGLSATTPLGMTMVRWAAADFGGPGVGP